MSAPSPISYGYLSLKDSRDQPVKMLVCGTCGAVIRESSKNVHVMWHRKLES
jgi:transcription initiation factor TFIIIB Brf1 subunit/transcription initiation factor TFIIB